METFFAWLKPEENTMRKITVALAAFSAIAFTVGAAQADKVIIKKHHHFDRDRHVTVIKRGEPGWRAHAEGRKVIIKHSEHRD